MRSAILTWHSLDDSQSVISTPPDVFRRQIESLVASHIPIVPLNRILQSPGSVALTFDDGFANLAEYAFPLLDRFHLPATVFVVSRYCGLSNQWPGQPPNSIPALPLLTWNQLSDRPATVEIGAHTTTHPHLTRLSAEDCDRELRECRDDIEQRLGTRVTSIAYPYGDSSQPVRAAAARHFEMAAGTSLRFLSQASDPLNLPRIDMYYFRSGFSIGRLFDAPGRIYVELRNLIRQMRAHLPG